MSEILWISIDDYPGWEMSSEGKVRSIENKKNYKKLVHDTLNRPIVIMYEHDGYATCWYVEDLYAVVFGAKLEQLPVVESPKVLKAFPDIEERKKVANPVKKGRRRKKIKCTTTGQIFSGWTDAASSFGFNYDKFYYRVKYVDGSYQGYSFEEVDDENV